MANWYLLIVMVALPGFIKSNGEIDNQDLTDLVNVLEDQLRSALNRELTDGKEINKDYNKRGIGRETHKEADDDDEIDLRNKGKDFDDMSDDTGDAYDPSLLEDLIDREVDIDQDDEENVDLNDEDMEEKELSEQEEEGIDERTTESVTERNLNELEKKTLSNIIQEIQKQKTAAANHAIMVIRRDRKLKRDYFKASIDKKYKTADSCRACMQLIHPPTGKGNPQVFTAQVLEEDRNQMYIAIKRFFRRTLFRGKKNGPQWNKFWFDVFNNNAVFRLLWKHFFGSKLVGPKPKLSCKSSRSSREYRTVDGSCNNVKHPTWGKAMTAQRRFTPAAFQDGLQEPRQIGVNGDPLPSARKVSNIISDNRPHLDTADDKRNTIALPAFGQFLDHDVTLTPISAGESGSSIKCCGINHDRLQCFPIKIPADDKRFVPNGCMEFIRSTPTISDRNKPNGIRETLNDITAFVDASNVYGSDKEKAKELRNGANMTEVTPGRHLPEAPDSECNITRPTDLFCKNGGDERVNEAPHLTMLHTAFVRLHNNIVAILESFNIENEEILFQEARRIVGAIMQHITYTEFLPIVLDERLLRKFRLKENTYHYNAHVDPSIRTEFSTAAFRFGHSLIQSNQACLRGNQFRINKPLEEHFFNPLIPQTCPGGIAGWIATNVCKRMDSSFVKALRDNLFLDRVGDAFDLVSLNIQRGRDHGIPSYTTVRCQLGLRCPKNFNDLKGIMTKDAINKLRLAYRNKVHDIDLFAGGVSEKPFRKGLVGETFGTLIAKQFSFLKTGDRFWYETNSPKIRFTRGQLSTIKNVRLSDVLCDAFRGELNELPKNVFRKNGKKRKCSPWATKKTLCKWQKGKSSCK